MDLMQRQVGWVELGVVVVAARPDPLGDRAGAVEEPVRCGARAVAADDRPAPPLARAPSTADSRTTPLRWLLLHRIHLAQEFLETSDLPVEEVSMMRLRRLDQPPTTLRQARLHLCRAGLGSAFGP